jgi:hypothetical protein
MAELSLTSEDVSMDELREYLVSSLDKWLNKLEKLETIRSDLDRRYEPGAYQNLSGSIFHYEGRVEQIRETLKQSWK